MSGLDRQRDIEPETAAGGATRGEGAVQQRDPFAQSVEAMPRGPSVHRPAGAVVGTVMVSRCGSYRISTSARRAWACLTTLVRPSCTTR